MFTSLPHQTEDTIYKYAISRVAWAGWYFTGHVTRRIATVEENNNNNNKKKKAHPYPRLSEKLQKQGPPERDPSPWQSALK